VRGVWWLAAVVCCCNITRGVFQLLPLGALCRIHAAASTGIALYEYLRWLGRVDALVHPLGSFLFAGSCLHWHLIQGKVDAVDLSLDLAAYYTCYTFILISDLRQTAPPCLLIHYPACCQVAFFSWLKEGPRNLEHSLSPELVAFCCKGCDIQFSPVQGCFVGST
jgi:hypothetical protein